MNSVSVLLNDTTGDIGQSLSINTNPIIGPLNGTVVINTNGTITYIPTNGFIGLDSLQYSVCDNGNPQSCDTATIFINVLPPYADVSVSKTVSNATPIIGETVTFTIVAQNNGPEQALGVTITDFIQSGFNFVSSNTTSGSYSNNVWNIGNMSNNQSDTLVVTAIVNANGNYLNTAFYTPVTLDTVQTNDTSSVILSPILNLIDRSVTKNFSVQPNATAGDTIIFTVTLTNNGNIPSYQNNLIDTLQSGYTFVSYTSTNGIYNVSNIVIGGINPFTWNVDTLLPGETDTLEVTAIINGGGEHYNRASIDTINDPTPTNNTAVANPTLASADLSLTKSVDKHFPQLNENITYTIKVNNAGPSLVSQLTVKDILPAELQFITSTPSQGSYNQASGIWTVADNNSGIQALNNGGIATLSIVAKVISIGVIINTAEVSSSNVVDPDSSPLNGLLEDDLDTAAIKVGAVDLSITKTVSDSLPSMVEIVNNQTNLINPKITFTITVINTGESAATGVSLVDTLSKYYNIIDYTVSKGVYSDSSHIWTIGNVGIGEVVTLTILVEILSESYGTNNNKLDYLNKAQIFTCNETDKDSYPGNDIKTEDDYAQVNVIPSGIIIPEGFSPNGDGIGDKFVIENPNGHALNLRVYNRWGTMVYKMEGYDNSWDGEVNFGFRTGEGLPDGTYYYIVDDTIDGNNYLRYITLKR